MVFNIYDGAVYLAGLYRDDHVRMWSTKNGQCVAALNCLHNQMDIRSRGCKHFLFPWTIEQCSKLIKSTILQLISFSSQTAQNNLLRKASSDVLCAYLCNSGGSEFVLVRMQPDQNGLTLQKVDVVPAPKFDLIEFDVNTRRIWGLWCNSQGEFNVSSYAFQSNSSCAWSSAGLETLPERKIEAACDPRHAYCSYIFYPGRFQRDVIDRALKVCAIFFIPLAYQLGLELRQKQKLLESHWI